METPYLPRSSVGTLGAGAPTATTNRTVSHGAPRFNGEQIVPLIHTDGPNVDNVEHERQNRLKRWQSPPTPTRKAML
jgi:hypothetical protein